MIPIKVLNTLLEDQFWCSSLAYLKVSIQAKNCCMILLASVRQINSIDPTSDDLDLGAIKHLPIVLNIKEKVILQKILKHGIRIAG
jgi:hypothetical protein